MFSKNKNIDPQQIEQREQYDYARGRIKQKKRLMQHFIVFLAGSILLIIINPVLEIGKDFFINNWFIWAILLWAFLFIVHLLNVFLMIDWNHDIEFSSFNFSKNKFANSSGETSLA